jgi:hypothetical protein
MAYPMLEFSQEHSSIQSKRLLEPQTKSRVSSKCKHSIILENELLGQELLRLQPQVASRERREMERGGQQFNQPRSTSRQMIIK